MIIVLLSGIFVFADQEERSVSSVTLQLMASPTPLPPSECYIVNCGAGDRRYLIIDDYETSPIFRHIEIFMDVNAFSEASLAAMFRELDGQYSEPENLTIEVLTDWSQLSKLGDCSGTVISASSTEFEQTRFHQAIYRRRGGKNPRKYFRFNRELDSYRNGQLN